MAGVGKVRDYLTLFWKSWLPKQLPRVQARDCKMTAWLSINNACSLALGSP